jgi:signal transduction histidine kinase
MNYTRTLARIAELSARKGSERDGIAKVGEHIAALLNAGAVVIFRFRSDGTLQNVASFGVPSRALDNLESSGSETWLTGLFGGSGEPVIFERPTKGGHQGVVDAWAELAGWATMALVPLSGDADGEPVGALVVGHATPRKYDTEECDILQVIGVLVSQVVERLDSGDGEVESSKSQLFSVLSHELRTPLTSIMGFTQLIRKRLSASPNTDRRTLEHLNVLWVQAHRLNRLIDTFVDMTRIERGEFQLTRGDVELTGLLRMAAEQSVAQAGSHNEVALDLPDEPLWVHGDSKRLEQAFGHILSNAVRYAPHDQPILLSCKVDPDESMVTIRITDRGPGIPASRLEEIFDRKHPSGPLKSGGLGVGLYLTRVIVEAHGGRISIESSSNSGTVVAIALPV